MGEGESWQQSRASEGGGQGVRAKLGTSGELRGHESSWEPEAAKSSAERGGGGDGSSTQGLVTAAGCA